ncbi:MAG: type III pantothenate kinase [Candidatus Saccharimonas sp.]|nr:type III pantothenate kinase [Planctomycetaceae bacterium]
MNPSIAPSPLLAIDAGNSRLKFGLFEPGRLSHSNSIWPECRQFLAVHVDDAIPWDVLSGWLDSSAPGATARQSAISGTNPRAVERLLIGWARQGWPAPFVVRDYMAVPVAVDVDSPEKVGLDRLLAAVAANALRPADRAAIVIDSGTATTVNYVSVQGTFCGGAILPGLEMSAKALHHYTALLPLLPVHELGGDEPVAPGRTTREAIRNGLLWGQVGAIRELVRQLCLRRGHDLPTFDESSESTDSPSSSPAPWLVLTGGGGPVLSPQFPGVMRLASLGMHGLVLTAWGTERREA